MAVRILLIDQDLPSVHEVQSTLAQAGYHVEHALPGRNAVRQVVLDEPNLVILAIEADEAGWQFCRRLLSFLDAPMLLLVSSADRLDRATGLNMGAAACLLKPVIMAELQAQVQALLRQTLSPAARRAKNFFVDGDLVVDLTRWEVKIDDEPVALTPTEFLLLACLIKHAGEVVPHERLLVEAWGSSFDTYRESLKQYIHHLRRKLEPDPAHPQRILTRWGKGYLFQRHATEE